MIWLETVRVANPELAHGTERVVQEGSDGVSTSVYEVVWSNGKPTDIGSAAVKPATHVALAAGDTPTKSEFDALVNSLIAAGLMAAE